MRVDLPIPASALAIGAHPDDIEFECGATFAKWGVAGTAIHFLVCTDGSKGTWDVSADIAALMALRKDEQRAAAERISPGATVHFLDEVDGELGNDLTLRGRVALVIREARADVVLGHDPWRRWRLHPDHRAAGFLAVDGVVAARDPHFYKAAKNDRPSHYRPDALLLFESEEPNHVEAVDRTHIEAKISALLAHESQFETTMVIDEDDDGSQADAFRSRVFAEARDHGRKAGVGFGEAFRLIDPAS